MKSNPFLDFAHYAGDPRKMLLVNDVDLAIQPSMGTDSTDQQKEAFNTLYDMTEGGLLLFTGRTPQSAGITFGHDYPGAFEHGSLIRIGLGQTVHFLTPKMDIEKLSGILQTALVGSIRLAPTPASIGGNTDEAVYIEKKNASIALVHTTIKGEFEGDPRPLEHLKSVRRILVPAAEFAIAEMGLGQTHTFKIGNDAVEIIAKGFDHNTEARQVLEARELERIETNAISKATLIHTFHGFFQDRVVHMLGDGAPDMDVAVEIKAHLDGWGTYVSNDIPLQEKYHHAVVNHRGEQSVIRHHTMTWPLIVDTAKQLFDAMPKSKLPLPPAGGMTPDLRHM